jgi:hypothetical protein
VPKYLASGRNPDGRQITERVEAASADEAVKLLEQRDFTDIVLHTSDIEAVVQQQMRALHSPARVKAVDRFLTPRDWLRLRNKGGYLAQVFFLIRKAYTQNWWVYVLALGLLAFRCFMHMPWGPLDYALIGIFFLPLVWFLPAPLFGPSSTYDRVINACAWGRWNEVLALLPAIRGKVTAHEIAFREAEAFAGLGKLDEALDRIQGFSDGEQMPIWLYWGRLSGVCATAHDFEASVAAMQKAAELAPQEPVVLLDYATALIRRKRDPVRAREFLERAKKHAISDVIAYAVDQCQGMIALDEGHPSEARDLLNQAMDKVTKFRKSSALIGAAIDRIHAFLALANAAAGDHAAALEHYRIAEPRLRALRYDDLIQRCKAALGIIDSS